MKKNLGNKRYEISDEQIDWITRTYIDGHNHGNSVIVPSTEFMFRQVSTRQPLRMNIVVDAAKTNELFKHSKPMSKIMAEDRKAIQAWGMSHEGKIHDFTWAYTAAKELRELIRNSKPAKGQLVKAIVDVFGVRSSEADIALDDKGVKVYDSELKDTENIPWGMDFTDYMSKEVWPYAPETEIDMNAKDFGPLQDDQTGVVGTSISFNRYFYKHEQPRDPSEIAKEILEIEDGIESFLRDFLK